MTSPGPLKYMLTLFLMITSTHAQSKCDRKRHVYADQSGDVVVVGAYVVHDGEMCDIMRSSGVRLVHAAHWAVDMVNQLRIVPDVTIGFRAIDLCGGVDAPLQRTLQTLNTGGFHLDVECRPERILGMVGPSDVEKSGKINDVLEAVSVPYVQSIAGGQRPSIKATIKILTEMNCTKVTLITFQGSMMSLFVTAANKSDICLSESILLHDKASMSDLTAAVQRLKSDESSTFVLFGNDLQIHTLMTVLKSANVQTTGTWIINGLTKVNETLFNQGMSFEKIIVVHPDGSKVDLEIEKAFDMRIRRGGGPLYTSLYLQQAKCLSAKEENCDFDVELDDFFVLQNAVLPVFAFAKALRVKMEECKRQQSCEGIPNLLQEDVNDVIEHDAIGALILDKVIQTKFSFFNHSEGRLNKVGSYVQEKLFLTEHASEMHSSCKCSGQCISTTLPTVHSASTGYLLFRHDTWIIVCLTIGGCGLLTDFVILIYIVVYVLRGRRTEGSQFFTLILIIGNMCLYACMLPYALQPSDVVCSFKVFGSSIATTIIFAVMLSRCLLMVTSDTKGFQGHISGLLQVVLFFLMLITQLVLVSLLWWFKRPEVFVDDACMEDHVLYFVSNGYNSLLLLLLVIFCPFAVRNRRNYKEGLQFTICNVLTLCSWVTWATLTFTQQPSTHDQINCITMVAIASVHLIVVFIPRVCAITMVPETKSYGIPTVSGNHLSAASNADICASSMRVYETINRGFVPDHEPTTNGNTYMVPTPVNNARVQMYRKATII